ncbi:hypothetical protein [Methylomonas sp.]|jgi:hypothetical protein|nr:hypothetical protein [Methylomonas sp.]
MIRSGDTKIGMTHRYCVAWQTILVHHYSNNASFWGEYRLPGE